MASSYHESVYTRSLNELIRKVDNTSTNSTSIVKDAKHYFETLTANEQALLELEQQREDLQQLLHKTGGAKLEDTEKELKETTEAIKQFHEQQLNARLTRLDRAIAVCESILELSEGKDEDETLVKSAKFLGTILLLSPASGKKLPELHQRLKPAYKAVLSIRLVDALMQEKKVKHKYLVNHYDHEERYAADDQSKIRENLLFPIMFAALFQDIGMHHPDAQHILRGENNDLDPYRVLEVEDRKQLLKVTYQQTIDYLTNGLGVLKYVGNSRDEREVFDQQQNAALAFCKGMLRDTIKPVHGLGEIIKIPQIYASVVLSTKRNYAISDLPKACVLIEKMAEKGSINSQVVKHFVNLVGHFPQGFGVTYIPDNEQDADFERYEYAIVNRLRPDNLYEPSCRAVTRKLTFVSSGQNLIINKSQNMYFESVRKQMAKMDKAKLQRILEKLQYNFEAQGAKNIVPDCWQAHDFFLQKEHQNLWNKA